MVAEGRGASARLRLTNAGADGDRAGPSLVFCVACRRMAAPDAATAGLSPDGLARSRFRALPIPATPDRDRFNTVCAGCTDGPPEFSAD